MPQAIILVRLLDIFERLKLFRRVAALLRRFDDLPLLMAEVALTIRQAPAGPRQKPFETFPFR